MMKQNKALTSVVSYSERGQGGNNRYRGNCSPKLIEDLIAHFRLHEVCDYMCGSNTTADAARTMGIVSHTYCIGPVKYNGAMATIHASLISPASPPGRALFRL